jgi:SAM-dependent methyltransferase
LFEKLKQCYVREQFQPSLLGMFVNPFFHSRKGLYQHISALAPHMSGNILDVGCGQKPYQHLFSDSHYIGLELDTSENRKNKKADFFYDGFTFPFDDGVFDGVVMNQVFEHVFNPEYFLDEVNKVLRDDGKLLMTVPFVWDEHEQPSDFARYSSFGLRALLERHGFSIIEHHKSIADIRVIFQLVNAYIYKITISRNKYVNMLLMLAVMAPVNIAGELLAKILPQNVDLFLDNIVLAKKVSCV